MSHSVVFSPEALAQLDALENFISDAGSPHVAARFIDNLINYCENLSLFRLRGSPRDDLHPTLRITHYRRTTVIAFVVGCEIKTVSILGVFYGGQDYATLLQNNDAMNKQGR